MNCTTVPPLAILPQTDPRVYSPASAYTLCQCLRLYVIEYVNVVVFELYRHEHGVFIAVNCRLS